MTHAPACGQPRLRSFSQDFCYLWGEEAISKSEQGADGIQTQFRFGELEAILADLNGVQSHQRTAFQARLKNFHRLGFPAEIGQGRGKAVIYSVHHLIEMAIVVELTQLGLTPERAIEVFNDDPYAVWMCIQLAAAELVREPGGFSPEWADHETTDPQSFFLYCDPAALAPWDEHESDRASSTFFFGSTTAVRENLPRWTTGPTRRLALINVSALLWQMATYIAGENGTKFLSEVFLVSQGWIHAGDFDLDEWLLSNVKWNLFSQAARAKWLSEDEPTWLPLKNMPMPDALKAFVFKPEGDNQPDLIIHLPGQRDLMVDAKVMPTVDIPQEAIRARVDELADKKPYRTKFSDRTDFILLYLPSEQFFTSAFAVDHDLLSYAFDKKVVIVTPRTFFFLLAKVQDIWEKRSETEEGKEEWEVLQSGDRRNPYEAVSPKAGEVHGDR